MKHLFFIKLKKIKIKMYQIQICSTRYNISSPNLLQFFEMINMYAFKSNPHIWDARANLVFVK